MVLLPLEIVHLILEYDGRIKNRNGKYMNQIAQDDDRYKMLQKIPQFYSVTTYDGSFSKMILLKNSIFYTKFFNVSYTDKNPIIEANVGFLSSHYSYTQDGIRYLWTIYYKDII